MALAVDRDYIHLTQQFAELPPWLALGADPQRVLELLRQRLPELTASVGPFDRLNVKGNDGRWTALYTFLVAGEGGASQPVMVQGTLYAPHATLPDAIDVPSGAAFGQPGWRCWLPDERLLLSYAEPEPESAPIPELADPQLVRPLLERTLREQAAGYADAHIESCTVKVLDHKPGSTTIFRYHLDYGPAAVGRPWRDIIFGKYYDGDKGVNAYAGMHALWASPLAHSSVVAIPEPLGYIEPLRTVLQSAVPEERNLEALLQAAVRDNTSAAWSDLTEYTRKTAIALAELHRSGVQHTLATTWHELHKEVTKYLKRLAFSFPDLAAGTAQLLARVEELLQATPADPAVPSHGAFRPEQVLIHQGEIGFIDFDLFCMAEPALDLARFRVMLKLYGSDPRRHPFDRTTVEERMGQLDAVNELFLSTYEALAPVTRQRVALWESLNHFKDLTRSWNRVRLADRTAVITLLQRNLRALGL